MKPTLMNLVALVGAGGIGATKVTDTIRNLVAHFMPRAKPPKWMWNAVTFAATIGVAFWANLNVLVGTHGGWGHLLAGIAVGGAAGGWHELLDLASSAAKNLHPVEPPVAGP